MDNKECPHCGKELGAKDRKCRFCGEWLVDPTTVRIASSLGGKAGRMEADALESPLGRYVQILMWIGIVAALLVWGNGVLSLAEGMEKGTFASKVLELCSVVPMWVVGWLESMTETALFYMLYHELRTVLRYRGRSLPILLIFSVVMGILFLGLSITHSGDMDMTNDSLGFFVLISLPNIFVSIVGGTLIIESYVGRLNTMGKMLIYIPLARILLFLLFMLAGRWEEVQYVSTFLMTSATVFQLCLFGKLLKKNNCA
ncbi:MAG: zinc ribbon domain-containing protein [Bacteroides sp.]|nr:zinc ribbon domain-containing protein [Bacteroides sp.]